MRADLRTAARSDTRIGGETPSCGAAVETLNQARAGLVVALSIVDEAIHQAPTLRPGCPGALTLYSWIGRARRSLDLVAGHLIEAQDPFGEPAPATSSAASAGADLAPIRAEVDRQLERCAASSPHALVYLHPEEARALTTAVDTERDRADRAEAAIRALVRPSRQLAFLAQGIAFVGRVTSDEVQRLGHWQDAWVTAYHAHHPAVRSALALPDDAERNPLPVIRHLWEALGDRELTMSSTPGTLEG